MGNRISGTVSPRASGIYEENSSMKAEYKRALARIPAAKVPRIRQIFNELTRQSSTSTGRVDKASFLRYFPLPGMMGERLFAVFDRDRSGSIDFPEFLTGLATIYHGTMEDKKRFLFDMYDLDGNGEITRDELFTMLSYIPAAFKILQLADPDVHAAASAVATYKPTAEMESKISKIVESVFGTTSSSLSFDEFQMAVSRNSAVFEIINVFYDEGLPENNSTVSSNHQLIKGPSASDDLCKCPFCETVLQFAHCMHCGALLPNRSNTAASELGPVSCLQCGFRLPEPHYCFSCGHPLKSTLDQREESETSSSSDDDIVAADDEHVSSSYQESTEGNSVLISGYLSKVGRSTLTRQRRFYILKDCFLYYYINAKEIGVPKGVIFLPGVFVLPLTDGDDTRFGFMLQAGSKKRRVFYCSNRSDEQKWIAALTRASKTRDIHEYYALHTSDCIGKGKFSSVFSATNKQSGEAVAVKVLNAVNDAAEREFIRTELAIVKLVSHPNVVRTIDVFEAIDSIYIVMERVDGGDLLHRLFREVRLSEFDTQRTVLPLLLAVQYIHEKGIIHRDIKPENILISSEGVVKLTDFGLSALVPRTMRLDAPLGTVGYAAPEVLMSLPYDRAVDMWSLGAVTYVMLAGEMPFRGKTDKDIAAAVTKAKFSFSSKMQISDSAKDFIKKLLVKKPENRMTASEALRHDWLSGFSKI